MEINQEITQPNHPFVAGFWLIAALPICVLVLFLFSSLLDIKDVYAARPASVMFGVHVGTGYLWSRSLGRRAGLTDNRMMNASGGLGFGLLVVGVIVFLPIVDPAFLKYVDLFKGHGNLEFGAFFAPWIGLVSGGSGFALGLGRRDLRLSLKLFGSGFLSGLILYLAIMFTMEFLGFRVYSGRIVMLPTTFMGMWAAALVGSAIFGKVLAQSRKD